MGICKRRGFTGKHLSSHFQLNKIAKIKSRYRAKRDGLAVKITGYKGCGFESQHPHGSSQISVTPDPGDPLTSGLHWNQARKWYIDTHAGKRSIYIR